MEENGKQTEDYTDSITFTYDKDKHALRKLWDEAFDDPEEFADYYFENVCVENRVLSAYVEEKLVGMVHLNPYTVMVDDQAYESYYVVGVAVDYEYRQRGIMKAMLNAVKTDLRNEGVPFIFLMPALEEYYNNLGFKKIYNTKSMDFTIVEAEDFEREVSDCYASLMLSTYHMSELGKEELSVMSEVVNQRLSETYKIYCKRDEKYLESMVSEHLCQCGDVCFITEYMMSEGEEELEDLNVIGVFGYGIDDDTMYVERFESFDSNAMALMISVLKLATETSCSRCIITVPSGQVDAYEDIMEGIELSVSDDKGIMLCALGKDEESFINLFDNNTFIDEIV